MKYSFIAIFCILVFLIPNNYRAQAPWQAHGKLEVCTQQALHST